MKSNINIADFSKALAHGDDNDQAELINEFAKELKVVCRDIKLEGAQPCAISDKLDKNGIDFIKSLYEFIKLREAVK